MSRQSNRLEMLINITSKGGPELSKLGSAAKKLGAIFDHLDKSMEKAELTTNDGRKAYRDFAGNINGLMDETNKYRQAKQKLNKELRKDPSKQNAATIDKLRTTTTKAMAAAKKYGETINKMVPGLVKLNFTTKKVVENTKLLAQAEGQAAVKAKNFIGVTKAKERAEGRASRSTKKNTKEVDRNTAAVRKNEFAQDNLRQRLNTSGGGAFAKMRRSVGALRNQILLLTFATVALRTAFNKAFLAANELEAAMKGLGAVASNTGNDMVKAQQAAQNLSDKGLLSVQDSAAGLKNLLSSGFGLREAINLMDTLTDSASFNRQGTLSLGQAVVGATQGIKNQNSIMVDNAGITKNLSIMYKEYAATIGTSAGKLDEAGKRQAIYNGILKEGQIFAGDAEKVVLTMSGALTKLGVNSEKAAAQIGKLTQPMASGFVQAFAEASDNILEFGKALEKNPEFIERMIVLGYKLEESIRYINATLGSLFSSLSRLNNFMGGMIAGFVKGTGVLMLFRLATRRSIKATQALYAENLKGTVQQLVMNNGKTKEITLYTLADQRTYKSLSLRKRYRIELQRLILNEEALTGAVVRGTAMQKLKNQALRTATANAKMTTVALKSLKAGVISLAATFGPLLIAWAVFEGLLLGWKKLTEWLTGVETQTKVNIKRNAQLTESYKVQFTAISNGYHASIAAANAFTDTQMMGLELSKSYIQVEQAYRKVLAERRTYAAITGLEEAAAQQIKIDKAMENYNLELEGLKTMQGTIRGRTSEHFSKLLAANVAYNEELEVKQKARGVDGIIDARKNLVNRLTQYEQFLAAYAKLTEKAQQSAATAQKRYRLEEAVDMARQNLELEREKTLGGHYDKMLDIREKYDAKLFEYNANDIERIKGQWASKRKIEEAKLKEHFDAMENLAKGAYLSSQEDYISNVGTNVIQATNIGAKSDKGSAYGEDTMGILGKELGGIKPAIAEEIGRTYDKLTAAQAQYKDVLWDSSASAEKINGTMENYKKSLVGVRGELSKNIETARRNQGEGTKGYIKMEQDLAQLDSLIGVLHTAGKEYAVLTDEKTSMDNQVSRGNEAYKEALKVLKESMTIEEQRALGAAFYKEDLKQLAVKYKELALAIQGTVDTEGNLSGALARGVMAAQRGANANKKFATSQQTVGSMMTEFLNPLQTSEILLRKQAKAVDSLATKQMLSRTAAEDKIKLAKLQLVEEKKILTEGIASGKYTDQQDNDQTKRITASQAKVKALEAEGAALLKTNDIEKQILADNHAAQIMQEKIANFTKYAEFFSGFIGKMQDLEHSRLMANMKYQKKLKQEVIDGIINQKQSDTLALENQKLTTAEKAKNEKLALAGLIRDVGRQIMVYAAKKAAERGKIGQALGLLAAGVLANAAINSYANKITREAEGDYMNAQAQFERREAEIRGEGDNAPGSANQQRFGGSIKAENLSVEINPTVVIQGEQVFIGQGSVQEFGSELQALLLTSVNDAIENREIDLSNVQG